MNKTYLGDGVYVELDEEQDLVLTSGGTEIPDNVIYINEEVYTNLLRYVEALKAMQNDKKKT